jgi:hypothetical protein
MWTVTGVVFNWENRELMINTSNHRHLIYLDGFPMFIQTCSQDISQPDSCVLKNPVLFCQFQGINQSAASICSVASVSIFSCDSHMGSSSEFRSYDPTYLQSLSIIHMSQLLAMSYYKPQLSWRFRVPSHDKAVYHFGLYPHYVWYPHKTVVFIPHWYWIIVVIECTSFIRP